MYLQPPGEALTEQQRRDLDDTFLSSDPFAYFQSRIDMLISWGEKTEKGKGTEASGDDGEKKESGGNSDRGSRSTRELFTGYLGNPIDLSSNVSASSVTTQIATDAYALRHHAAESLLRLTAVLVDDQPQEKCIWEGLSMGPNQLDQVIAMLRPPLTDSSARKTFAKMVIPDSMRENLNSDERLDSALSVFRDWLQFSSDLMTGHELHLNAAHNKVKHGLAVRARDNLRVSFSHQGPNPDGTVSLSAFTAENSIDIFDRPVIEVLAAGPKVEGHRQGLELTQLRVDLPVILAETFMIAWTHGAMFHVAAARHFAGRDLRDHVKPPVFPGLPVGGPHPHHIAAQAPVGMRFPMTTPPSGGDIRRPAGLGFRDVFIPLHFTGEVVRQAVVVDDGEGTKLH